MILLLYGNGLSVPFLPVSILARGGADLADGFVLVFILPPIFFSVLNGSLPPSVQADLPPPSASGILSRKSSRPTRCGRNLDLIPGKGFGGIQNFQHHNKNKWAGQKVISCPIPSVYTREFMRGSLDRKLFDRHPLNPMGSRIRIKRVSWTLTAG